MASVREATLELFRAHGMTTIFGNPGSTELPMLRDLPDDFTYVLGLQEQAVVGMADGYAPGERAPDPREPAHRARASERGRRDRHRAGQQGAARHHRRPAGARPDHPRGAAHQPRRHVVPQPYVKWSHEPPRPQDVPGAIGRAIHHATLAPRGPAFVSIPMDDWDAEADEDRAVHARRRVVDGRAVPDPAELAQLASLLESARSPVIVAGPDVDASGGWNAAVALAEKQRLPVWAPPPTASSRIGFPEGHPNFMGILPPAIGPVAEALKGHDVVLVVGISVFAVLPVHPWSAPARGDHLSR